MPRRAEIQVRPIEADPVYNSPLVTQVINKVMSRGKKSTAEKIVYDVLDRIGERTGKPPVEVLEQAVKTVTPVLEVKSRRVGGATYQVPVEVRPRRATTLAIRWVVDFSRARREKSMSECLAGELLDAANGLGAAMKRRDDTQKMAESNKAFAHYRF
jgi:small subunit ribosomal protein S7